MLGISDFGAFCAAILVFLAMPGPGTLALLYARQAFLITLLNPKAIVFYMAFFPLFIDPATHRGFITFAAMAVTIASITAVYCLGLCALAGVLAARVKAHKRLSVWLSRLAGVFLIGFGLRMIRP